jgi:hypothetical protein
MSIILAIEPDRRRAAQLTGMARAHLRAELLVASTASQALGGRVPDVLLTAPLLPSHEEAAMADYLRQLGPAAAHVQTLTIPLLAGGSGERDRPVLSAFRRERNSRTEPEGCDPAVFAEQITEYLREAQERRDAPAPTPSRLAEAPVGDNAQAARLTTKSTTNERFQRLLAAAVEEEPDDFREFTIEPLKPLGESAPDIKLSRAFGDDGSTDDVPTYAPDLSGIVGRHAAIEDDAAAESMTNVKVFAVKVGDDRKGAIGATPIPRRPRRARPAQDEWSFFDPNQCGFPALIAKLDEIASRESDS